MVTKLGGEQGRKILRMRNSRNCEGRDYCLLVNLPCCWASKGWNFTGVVIWTFSWMMECSCNHSNEIHTYLLDRLLDSSQNAMT
jgi:hypothetical protein